jgi:uncharacterized coiled-coil protein SlyX
MFGLATMDNVYRLDRRIDALDAKVNQLMGLVDDLRAAVAADKATDDAVVAYLTELKGSVDSMSAQLQDALAKAAAADPELVAAVQDAIAALQAHSVDMGSHTKPAPAAPVDVPPAA